MENGIIRAFLSPGSGSGSGSGFGSGYGYGYGYGDGYGYGSGSGSGYGYGYGYGDGYGVKNFRGQPVNTVDGLATLIDRVHGDLARGKILNRDLTTTPCYIVKGSGFFAHGETLGDALQALEEKILENMSDEEKYGQFLEQFRPGQLYPAMDFFRWHHTLTGSCDMGRRQFAREHEIDLDKDTLTPEQFFGLTKDAYGSGVIRGLMEAWREKYHEEKAESAPEATARAGDQPGAGNGDPDRKD